MCIRDRNTRIFTSGLFWINISIIWRKYYVFSEWKPKYETKVIKDKLARLFCDDPENNFIKKNNLKKNSHLFYEHWHRIQGLVKSPGQVSCHARKSILCIVCSRSWKKKKTLSMNKLCNRIFSILIYYYRTLYFKTMMR